MRLTLAVGLTLTVGTLVLAQDVKTVTRYGVVAIFNKYPQKTPRETLESVIKAMEAQHVDYVLAHLTDPAFVDRRVKEYGGKFDELVEESRTKLAGSPATVKLLRRFLKDGEWDIDKEKNTAAVKLKDLREQQVFLKKVGDRWYMENRIKPMAEGK